MNNSQIVSLGDICSMITDGKHGDCQNETNSGYYFISAKDVFDGNIHYENARQITYQCFLETHRRTDLTTGDILVTNSGTIGRLAIAKEDEKTARTTFQKSVAILKPIEKKITSKYLYYSLAQNKNRLINTAGGAAQKNLLLGEMRRFQIPLPPLPTQKRIADILSTYDDLIENNNRRIALLEQAARHLYKEWFVRFKFPGHEKVKVVDGVPEGWERKTFSEVVSINPREKLDTSRDIKFSPMGALNTDTLVIDENQIELREKGSGVKYRNGDTLFARITPCLENGKTGFVDFLDDDEVGSGSTEFIVFRQNKVSKYFVYLLSREDDFRGNAIKSMVGPSGRQRVQTSCFDKYIVPKAGNTLLRLFDEAVKSNFYQIFTLKNQNRQLKSARDLFLPKLMNGELAV